MAKVQDDFREAVRTICKVRKVPPRRVYFEKSSGFVTINIRNKAAEGLDINCYKIIDIIYNLIGSKKVKFQHTTFNFPDSDRVDRIVISFEEKDYEDLLDKLFKNAL